MLMRTSYNIKLWYVLNGEIMKLIERNVQSLRSLLPHWGAQCPKTIIGQQ